jgi:sugar phosphate isomerase/epimerase
MNTRQSLRARIGIDIGRRLPLERAIEWAVANDVTHLDIQTDREPNPLEWFDDKNCARVRAALERHGLHLALHTLSGVNIAEFSPYLREGADAYLRGYIDVAKRLQADWIVVHAGYHFTSDKADRMKASLARLQRASAYAESQGVTLLLENMNREPERAEVRYLGHDVEECRYFFDQLASPNLRWSFTVNHATLVPEGIDGFLAAFPIERCAEVRLADNNGEYEVHLHPGEGIIDFGQLLKKIEGAGFQGHYTCAWGTLDQMLAGRDYILERAREAGVALD